MRLDSVDNRLRRLLWILAIFLFCAAAAIASPAQTFTLLDSFTTGTGYDSVAPLLLGSDGYFYGTTSQGGNMTACQNNGCGTIFKVNSSGTGSVIYAFTGDVDGYAPQAALIEVNGVLYGTAAHGGGNIGTQQGTIFKVGLDGSNFTTLYTFSGGSDGGDPVGALLLGADGNLYGTTSQGGYNQNTACSVNGCGTIYVIAPNGSNFTSLYQFSGPDGIAPEAGLTQDPTGNFYGTTGNGGAICNATLTCGTVFKFQTNPLQLTTLHSFNATTDGAHPIASVVRGSDGTLYGTAQYGGNLNCGVNVAAEGCGTIFSVKGATFNVLWTFQGTQGGNDASQPFDNLTFGTDGKLYGTTEYGGSGGGGCTFAAGCGTIFSITTGGALQILHSFTVTDGSEPLAGLIESNGTFYGTTGYGGSSSCGVQGCGTIFSLMVSSTGKTATTTAVMVTPSSIQQGATGGVTLSATVTPASGTSTPTGNVTFFNGTSQVGQASLSAGMTAISYNTSALAANTYAITASYAGDSNFSASTSAATTLTVTPPTTGTNPTTTALSITGNPSATQADSGSTVSFTATVAHTSGSSVPSGTVTFMNDSAVLGSATLNGTGVATYSTSSLAANQYSVTASYSGDRNYAASTSVASTLDIVDFQMAATPATINIGGPGGSGSTTLSITPLGGFNQTLSFTCAGLPIGATCSFASAQGGETISITAGSAPTAASLVPSGRPGVILGALLLPGFLGILSMGTKRNASAARVMFLFCTLGFITVFSGCNLGGKLANLPPPPATSTVTVTAAAGSLSHQTTIALTIQ